MDKGEILYNQKKVRDKIARLEKKLDKKHVESIDSLIPIAQKRARMRWKESGLPLVSLKESNGVSERWTHYNHDNMSQFFHEEMNKLKKTYGLTAW